MLNFFSTLYIIKPKNCIKAEQHIIEASIRTLILKKNGH